MCKVINIFLLLASAASTLLNLDRDLENVVWLSDNLGKDQDILPFYTLELKKIMNRIVESDPVSLMERMVKVRSLEKMVFFWYNYDLVAKPKFKYGPLLITKIDKLVVEIVLTNFKCYVLETVLNLRHYSEDFQVKFFEAAMDLYNIWMKKFNGHEIILHSLPKQCQMLSLNEPISLIISEFYDLEKSLAGIELPDQRNDFRIHLENFYMLVQYFTSHPDDLNGLIWVVNQTPQFIFLYLLFHKNPALLESNKNRRNFVTSLGTLRNLRLMILWSLNNLIPIFDWSFQEKSINLRFYDLSQYVHPIVANNGFLESLVREIVTKIVQITIDDL